MREGYIASLVGSLAGLALLGGLVGALTYLLDYRTCDPNGFDCLGAGIAVVMLGMAGAAVGAVLGCHGALRFRKYPRAGRTSWILAGLLVVTITAAALVGNAVSDTGELILTVVVGVLLADPFVARWLAIGRERPGQAP